MVTENIFRFSVLAVEVKFRDFANWDIHFRYPTFFWPVARIQRV